MIYIDVSDLISHIEEDIALTEQQLVALTAKTTLDAQRDLIVATPVDTNRARSGWDAITPTRPYEEGAIENNVPYIVDLNNGHSKQAPADFVESVVQRYNGGNIG